MPIDDCAWITFDKYFNKSVEMQNAEAANVLAHLM